MKKIFNIAFLILLIISFKNVSALESGKYIKNANNIIISEERYLELMDAGYTIDQIYNMTQNELDNANTDNDNIAISTKYLKTVTTTRYGTTTSETTEVTEQEYLNESGGQISLYASGSVETTYKKLTAQIVPSENGGGLMRYKAYLNWKNMPSNRSYDIIGMGFESGVVEIVYAVSFRNMYTYDGTTYVNGTHSQKISSNGVGAVFAQPENTISTLTHELTFEVRKVNSNSTVTSLHSAGDFAHAIDDVVLSTVNANYYTTNSSGLVLYSAIYNKYDTMSEADVYWTGTW